MSATSTAPPGPTADDRSGATATAGAQRPGSDFTTLAQAVREAGLLRRRPGYYWIRMIGAVAAIALWAIVFVRIGDSWWQLISAVALALIMTQIAFLAHDAGHKQIFTSARANELASLVLADLLVGISAGWWQRKHNRHHANPNKEGRDPDIDIDTVAFTPARARRRTHPVARWLVARQGWWFFPILLLEGLSLHVQGLKRVLGPEPLERRRLELTFLVLRGAVFLGLAFAVLSPVKALVFLAVEVAVFGFYLGSSFAPNHTGMPLVSARLRLDFLRRQVLMSRNISGGQPMSLLMGGLNYQIEHHLFPSMPRPHLRRVQPLVRAHCAAHGVPYTQTSLPQAYRIVLGYLNTVGLRHRDPFLCPLAVHRGPSGASAGVGAGPGPGAPTYRPGLVDVSHR